MTATANRRASLLGAVGTILAAPTVGRPQGRFPERQITLLVPFSAGGTTDVQMRSLAQAASRAFGQQVIIENRPGAGSTLGAQAVARGRPNGYTVAQLTLNSIRLPLMQRMAYDPARDFSPILQLTGYSFTVIVRAESPYRSWGELVADARAHPGRHRWGNTGANGTSHLTMIELAERERLEVVHVPFRGETDSLHAVLGGHIEAATAGTANGKLVQEGRLRFLNCWTRTRIPRFPEVPTLLELGYEGMIVTSPYGLVAPAGLEPTVRDALHDGFRRALHDSEHLETLERLDMPVEYLSPADYARSIQEIIVLEMQRIERLGLRQG